MYFVNILLNIIYSFKNYLKKIGLNSLYIRFRTIDTHWVHSITVNIYLKVSTVLYCQWKHLKRKKQFEVSKVQAQIYALIVFLDFAFGVISFSSKETISFDHNTNQIWNSHNYLISNMLDWLKHCIKPSPNSHKRNTLNSVTIESKEKIDFMILALSDEQQST